MNLSKLDIKITLKEVCTRIFNGGKFKFRKYI